MRTIKPLTTTAKKKKRKYAFRADLVYPATPSPDSAAAVVVVVVAVVAAVVVAEDDAVEIVAELAVASAEAQASPRPMCPTGLPGHCSWEQ